MRPEIDIKLMCSHCKYRGFGWLIDSMKKKQAGYWSYFVECPKCGIPMVYNDKKSKL